MCYSSNVYGIICFFENNNNGRFGVGMIVCEFLRWLIFFDEMNFVFTHKVTNVSYSDFKLTVTNSVKIIAINNLQKIVQNK